MCALCSVFVARAERLPDSAEVDEVMKKLARITGFRVKKPVKFQAISRVQVAKYLDGRLQDSTKPEDVALEELALRELGFIPDSYSLRESTLSLMTEQAAAFYDYNRKALFLSDWTPGGMRDTAVIHELAHALADQNFNLGKYVRKVSDDERSLSREAVVEGQATYLMDVYESAGPMAPDTSQFDRTFEATGEYPEFDKAPLYLRMTLVFPYTWGMAFQSALVAKLGQDGFAEPFRHAPVSTQQILHPEMYFAGSKPTRPKLPMGPKHWKPMVGGPLGELDHIVLLRQYGPAAEAAGIASGLRGAEFGVLEEKSTKRHALVYASEWKDEDSAGSFMAFYRKCLAAKWKTLRVVSEDGNSFAGSGSKGYFRVERVGKLVRSMEGFPEVVTH